MQHFIKNLIRRNPKKKGFTLLEMLLVIAAIGVLASIVIVAINPLRQLNKARDVSRLSALNQLGKALHQYYINEGSYPAGIDGTYREICNTGRLTSTDSLGSIDCTDDGSGQALLDLRVLVPTYIAEIPSDNSEVANAGAEAKTGYRVAINPDNNKISLWSDRQSGELVVAINPKIAMTVTGTNQAGQTLTATFINGITPPEENIIWYTVEGGVETQVGTGTSYIVQSGDAGKEIIAKVVLGGESIASGSGGNISSPAITFAKKAGGTIDDRGNGIASYSDGSSVVTGWFGGTAIFGEGGNQVSLVSSGGNDIFIAKYDNAGNLVWAKKAGGTGYDYGYAIASYSDGSSVVTGYFQGTAIFGEGGSQVSLVSSGGRDIFIAKYDNAGNLVWAKKAGGTSDDRGYGIASYSDGSSVVTGFLVGTAIFGEGGSEVSLVSSGVYDIFIAKYDNAGNLVWAKKAGGTDYDVGLGIASYSDGSSVVTGWLFRGTAIFGEGGSQVSLVSSGGRDIFIAKYDNTGNLVWAKKAGGTSSDGGVGIASYSDGSSVVTGWFEGTVSFGEGGSQVSLVSSGFGDIFIAKYDNAGNLVWAKKAGGTNSDVGYGIASYSDGSSVVTGVFRETAIFGEGGSQVSLVSSGFTDIFIAKYDENGELSE